MKKYLTTGLAILLPMIITSLIVGFLINFLTKPFLATFESIFKYFDLFTHPFLFLDGSEVLRLMTKLTILIGIAVFVFIIGLLGKLFLINYLFKLGDKFLGHVPFISKIYKACQDVVQSLFSSESKSFSQVVLVPFPTTEALSIGLVTKEDILLETDSSQTIVPVFVPGTPNPSMGFMLMLKKEELIFIDMKVEEAMKFVVSCGVVMSAFNITSSIPKVEPVYVVT